MHELLTAGADGLSTIVHPSHLREPDDPRALVEGRSEIGRGWFRIFGNRGFRLGIARSADLGHRRASKIAQSEIATARSRHQWCPLGHSPRNAEKMMLSSSIALQGTP